MILCVPTLEDVYSAWVERVGGLHEVKAARRLTSLANNILVYGQKFGSVGGIDRQAAGDDQHGPTLGNEERYVDADAPVKCGVQVGVVSKTTSRREELVMAESVYKVIELVGTSGESWEKAASAAVTTASASLRDLRIAEVAELDLQLEDGKVKAYRARVKVSFKYEGGD